MARNIRLAHELLKKLDKFKGKFILTESEGKEYENLTENLNHCRRELGEAVYSRVLQTHLECCNR